MDTPVTNLPVDLSNLARLSGRDFESSQIHGFEYAPATKQLFVQFKSNVHRVTYAYKDISPELAAEAEAAESKGKFFGRSFTSAHTDFDKLPGIVEPAPAENVEAGQEAA